MRGGTDRHPARAAAATALMSPALRDVVACALMSRPDNTRGVDAHTMEGRPDDVG
jgi:hypothetical protein